MHSQLVWALRKLQLCTGTGICTLESLIPLVIKGKGNQAFYFEWGNFNRITASIMLSNFVNTSAGIIIQEIKPDFDTGSGRILPVFDRKKKSILEKVIPETLAPVHTSSKVGPKFAEDAEFSPPELNEEENQVGLKVCKIVWWSRGNTSSSWLWRLCLQQVLNHCASQSLNT